jgi:hypothetical protein
MNDDRAIAPRARPAEPSPPVGDRAPAGDQRRLAASLRSLRSPISKHGFWVWSTTRAFPVLPSVPLVRGCDDRGDPSSRTPRCGTSLLARPRCRPVAGIDRAPRAIPIHLEAVTEPASFGRLADDRIRPTTSRTTRSHRRRTEASERPPRRLSVRLLAGRQGGSVGERSCDGVIGGEAELGAGWPTSWWGRSP